MLTTDSSPCVRCPLCFSVMAHKAHYSNWTLAATGPDVKRLLWKSPMWFNLIQPTKNSCISAATQSESVWLWLLSPSLLIDEQLRETADCSAIITKRPVISIEWKRLGNLGGLDRVKSNVNASSLVLFCKISAVSCRDSPRACSNSGLLSFFLVQPDRMVTR